MIYGKPLTGYTIDSVSEIYGIMDVFLLDMLL